MEWYVDYLIWKCPFIAVTFAMNFGSRPGGIKMGILLKPGAIPVAVKASPGFFKKKIQRVYSSKPLFR
jgi:hypothetical protein